MTILDELNEDWEVIRINPMVPFWWSTGLIFIFVSYFFLSRVPPNFPVGFPLFAMGFAFFTFGSNRFSVAQSRGKYNEINEKLKKLEEINDSLKKLEETWA
jgi:hypothetical protein